MHTAWRTGEFDDVRGDRIRIVLDHTITTDHVNLVQVLDAPNDRFITRALVRFDGGAARPVDLGPASRTAAGQTISFPTRRFRSFEIQVQDTNAGATQIFGGLSAVGFAEIRLRDDAPDAKPVVVHEVLRMPSDLLRAAGAASGGRPLVLLMNRDRVLPAPARQDPEASLVRRVALPTARDFAVAGQLRLSRLRSDPQIDRTLGYTGPVVATSSARLVGAPAARASSALDHDVSTAWETPFRSAVGSWIDLRPGALRTMDHLDLELVADGRHSVPTAITVSNDTGQVRHVELQVPKDSSTPGATVSATARFPSLTGSRFRVTIDRVRPVLTREYDCGCDVETPAAIAELGVPRLPVVAPPATLPTTCRADVLRVDGTRVPVRLSGTTADAVALQPIAISACGGERDPVTVRLDAGRHDVRSGSGASTGLDVDRLVWSSRPGGAIDRRLTTAGQVQVRSGGPSPAVRVLRSGRASLSVQVAAAPRPSWLVLGQSQNAGWRATIDGHDAGGSRLVDGYANGWVVPPHAHAITIDLEWVPQRTVQRALAVSIVSVMLCLGIVLVSTRRRALPAAAAVGAGDAWPVLGRGDATAGPVGLDRVDGHGAGGGGLRRARRAAGDRDRPRRGSGGRAPVAEVAPVVRAARARVRPPRGPLRGGPAGAAPPARRSSSGRRSSDGPGRWGGWRWSCSRPTSRSRSSRAVAQPDGAAADPTPSPPRAFPSRGMRSSRPRVPTTTVTAKSASAYHARLGWCAARAAMSSAAAAMPTRGRDRGTSAATTATSAATTAVVGRLTNAVPRNVAPTTATVVSGRSATPGRRHDHGTGATASTARSASRRVRRRRRPTIRITTHSTSATAETESAIQIVRWGVHERCTVTGPAWPGRTSHAFA